MFLSDILGYSLDAVHFRIFSKPESGELLFQAKKLEFNTKRIIFYLCMCSTCYLWEWKWIRICIQLHKGLDCTGLKSVMMFMMNWIDELQEEIPCVISIQVMLQLQPLPAKMFQSRLSLLISWKDFDVGFSVIGSKWISSFGNFFLSDQFFLLD